MNSTWSIFWIRYKGFQSLSLLVILKNSDWYLVQHIVFLKRKCVQELLWPLLRSGFRTGFQQEWKGFQSTRLCKNVLVSSEFANNLQLDPKDFILRLPNWWKDLQSQGSAIRLLPIWYAILHYEIWFFFRVSTLT